MTTETATRREQVLATAADLFATRGFHGVSVAELGADATTLLGRVRIQVVAEAIERLVERGALRFEAGLLLMSGADKMERRVAEQLHALVRPVRGVWDSSSSFWVAHGSATSQGTSQIALPPWVDTCRTLPPRASTYDVRRSRRTSLTSLSRSRSMPASSTT